MQKYLLNSIKSLLFITALTPLIYVSDVVYPFITGKAIFFRVLIEFTLILFLILILLELNKTSGEKLSVLKINSQWSILLRSPIFLSLAAFYISLIVSTIFAVNSYRAFWGTIERAEGLFGLLHFFIFLTLTVLIFDKKDWLRFIKLSVIIACVVAFYGLLQYIGVKNFFFITQDITGISRVGSFIGNSAFLASYLVLAITLVFIVFSILKRSDVQILTQYKDIRPPEIEFRNLKLNKFWRYFSILCVFLFIAVIFMSGTRGAILGLGVGIIFFLLYLIFGHRKFLEFTTSTRLNIRALATILLILIMIFGVVFLFTRNNLFWQKIPGLDRLAKTNIFENDSANTRLLLWGSSLKAFVEKPFLGWGPENYIITSNKYYNAKYVTYGSESWFDHAHNKYFDVLVTQGIFGLLTYLSIFISIFYLLFKKQSNFLITITIIASFIAYLVQNFFSFEDLNVYLLFFTIVGFLISESLNSEQSGNSIIDSKFKIPWLGRQNSKFSFVNYQLPWPGRPITKIIIVIVIIVVGYTVYAYSYIPYKQSKIASLVISYGGNDKKIINLLQESFYPYNFFQAGLRAYVAEDFYNNKQNIFTDIQLNELSKFVEKSIDEQITFEPNYDPRWYIQKGRILNLKASTNSQFYIGETEALKKAITLSPYRQELYYILFELLINQKRFEEAAKTAYSVILLNNSASRPRYYLALAYATAKEKEKLKMALKWFDDNDPYLENILYEEEKQNMLSNYFVAERNDAIARIIWHKLNSNKPFTIDVNYYMIAFRHFITIRDIDKIATLAKLLIDNNLINDTDKNTFLEAIKSDHWELIEEDKNIQKSSIQAKKQTETLPSKEKLINSLKEYIANHNKENILKNAKEIIAKFPEMTDDMEVIIDLTNKEQWEILEKL